ncbi:helix-turn-helix domain-containing protein [Devosia sp. A369]
MRIVQSSGSDRLFGGWMQDGVEARAEQPGAIVQEVGSRFKAMRLQRKWTLENVAGQTGLAISTLSKIENGHVSASFDTIVKVAHVYGYSFAEFFGGQMPADAQGSSGEGAIARRTVTRANEGTEFSSQHYEYSAHSSELTRKGMIPLVAKILTREPPPVSEWSSHDGDEFIYVCEGEVQVYTEYYSPVHLKIGDSTYFDSRMKHFIARMSEGPATVLSICMTEKFSIDDFVDGTRQ